MTQFSNPREAVTGKDGKALAAAFASGGVNSGQAINSNGPLLGGSEQGPAEGRASDKVCRITLM